MTQIDPYTQDKTWEVDKNVLKIGIDPSLKNCGVALIFDNHNLPSPQYTFRNFTFNVDESEYQGKTSAELMMIRYKEWGDKIFDILDKFKRLIEWSINEIYVAVEVSFIPNQRSITTAGKLNMISALVMKSVHAWVNKYIQNQKDNNLIAPDKVEYKFVLPSAWQSYIKAGFSEYVISQNSIKELSLKKANRDLEEFIRETITNDNIADAYNIAVNADRLHDWVAQKVSVRREKKERQITTPSQIISVKRRILGWYERAVAKCGGKEILPYAEPHVWVKYLTKSEQKLAWVQINKLDKLEGKVF